MGVLGRRRFMATVTAVQNILSTCATRDTRCLGPAFKRSKLKNKILKGKMGRHLMINAR